jgi:hypothetical protein
MRALALLLHELHEQLEVVLFKTVSKVNSITEYE